MERWLKGFYIAVGSVDRVGRRSQRNSVRLAEEVIDHLTPADGCAECVSVEEASPNDGPLPEEMIRTHRYARVLTRLGTQRYARINSVDPAGIRDALVGTDHELWLFCRLSKETWTCVVKWTLGQAVLLSELPTQSMISNLSALSSDMLITLLVVYDVARSRISIGT